MINITLLCVGKVKESYFTEAIAEYEKRLRKFAKVEIIEVADERIPETPAEADLLKVLDVEGKRLLAKIPRDAFVLTLEIEGKEMTSPDLADLIAKVGTYETSKLVFIIGGSLGLAKEVKQVANTALSFSKMTFPHQLMRVVLLEQIYRAFTILNHIAYHK